MNKLMKFVLLPLLVAFGILQFFRGDYPEVRLENRADIHTSALPVSAEVSGILRAACYDCHSMETKWPWYSKVAPISWSIIDHIREGREDLNFSEWQNLPKRTQIKLLKEIAEEVEKGDMPHPQYVWMHPEARLSDKQRRLIINWANTRVRKTLVRPAPESSESTED
jgi:hypothetical protein